LKDVTEVTREHLLSEVAARLPLGYRFVTMTCIDLGDAHELIYHFDKDMALDHLRLRLPKGEAAPSISPVYAAAALAENEIQDFFNLTFSGLILDYEGRFLLSANAPTAPLGGKKPAPPKEKKAKPSKGDEEE
jgi:ech hydrogenase subunit D